MEGDDLAGGFFTCYQGEGGFVEACSEVAVYGAGVSSAADVADVG